MCGDSSRAATASSRWKRSTSAELWVDRALSSYESYVWIPDRVDDHADALATLREVLP